MEALAEKTCLFPGCSLEGTANPFDSSAKAVLKALGLPLRTLRDWTCCGATSAHAVDHRLHLALNARNLALAEAQGFEEILAPCAACYHRLAGAAFEFSQHPETLRRINADGALSYRGSVRVLNLLEFLVQRVGLDRIAERVVHPLDGLRVVSYYGCLNTRIPRMACFDSRENPTSMDRIVAALGAEALDWSYKTDCCGASLFLTAQSVSARLTGKILKDAATRGAECVAVSCPMCQNNLDTKQDAVRAAFGIERPMPIVFITQLMGLAMGLSEKQLGLSKSFVPLQVS